MPSLVLLAALAVLHDFAAAAGVATTLAILPAEVKVEVVTVTRDGIASVSPAPTKCDYAWCDTGTSWCEYFAGATGWNPSEGIVPGETPVPIGACVVGNATVVVVTTTTTTTLVTEYTTLPPKQLPTA